MAVPGACLGLQVRHRKPLGGQAVPGALAAVHGYLFLTTPSAALVFNITGPVYATGPRSVAADTLSNLGAMCGQQARGPCWQVQAHMQACSSAVPVAAGGL